MIACGVVSRARATGLGILASIWASIWLAPSAARACSCLPPPPPDAASTNAAVVFEGRIDGVVREGMHNHFTFDVSRVFKGDLGAQVVIRTASSSAACGRGYEAGRAYLVYARRGANGQLGDGLCSRTRDMERAAEDLAVLGPGRAPRDPSEVGADPDPGREPPRIHSSTADPAVPPSSPGPRGCTVENAHIVEPPWLLVLVGGAVAIRRRRGTVAGDRNPKPSRSRHVAGSVQSPPARK